MKVVLFEDENVSNLYPLVFLRPVFDLRCGIFTLKEKVEKKFPDADLYLETRDELDAVAAETHGPDMVNSHQAVRPDDDILLINAGAVLTGDPSEYAGRERVGVDEEGNLIWAYLNRETVERLDSPASIGLAQKAVGELNAERVDDLLIRYPWDLIIHNPEQVTSDFESHYTAGRHSDPMPGAKMIGDNTNLYVGEDVELQPFTLIDCREGPVIIEDGATVHAHTSIEGPTFIGRDTQLFEAKIREGCSIGPVCRAGGEVEESIMHGYSNKYHTGFLGHAYVCEWVNLGALTTNSDLKNDYSTVKLRVHGGRQMDSGSMKVGSFIGDHTKTSIGTMLNTGSVIGIMCNLVAGSSVLPKRIPSFCWYLQDRVSKGLGLKYALKTARAAMGRRDKELSDAMVELIEHAQGITREEKMKLVKRDRRKMR
jgi:UDP-N-acetylglucosamine diphosphorylase/glucosamine-1-phosphate N-acetyltransferase